MARIKRQHDLASIIKRLSATATARCSIHAAMAEEYEVEWGGSEEDSEGEEKEASEEGDETNEEEERAALAASQDGGGGEGQ